VAVLEKTVTSTRAQLEEEVISQAAKASLRLQLEKAQKDLASAKNKVSAAPARPDQAIPCYALLLYVLYEPLIIAIFTLYLSPFLFGIRYVKQT